MLSCNLWFKLFQDISHFYCGLHQTRTTPVSSYRETFQFFTILLKPIYHWIVVVIKTFCLVSIMTGVYHRVISTNDTNL